MVLNLKLELYTETVMGQQVFYDIGNFLYLAGELNSRFWEDFVRQYGLDYKIIISEDTKWQDFLHQQTGANFFCSLFF